jgi:hypothetical protein
MLVPPALAASHGLSPRPNLTIPRVEKPPALEDFAEMAPSKEWAGKLARVDDFRQQRPKDGEPATERTEAYLGFDDKHLYVIFVAFDSEPHKLRARMVNRENWVDEHATMLDDGVSISLDTFNDQRRGYVFQVNPLGVQWDGLFSDGRGFDASFDAVWYSRGKITDRGFVIWIAIPFRSLRFSAAAEQNWGILLNRDIPRKSEVDFWPHLCSQVNGYINQAAPLRGLSQISPGRNLQFIPYGAFRSFRALDLRDPNAPRFVGKDAEFNAGMDAKIVLKDSVVFDFTANPDFGQVESDEPQITANERFEVFFPEKRPFFLENSSYFQTPINLLFTRRIADPQFGARLTGKLGPWALGAMFVDDQSPGRSAPAGDPLENRRAFFSIVRVNRDIFRQSSLGFIFTDRELECGPGCTVSRSFNRVGGVDGRFRLNQQWVAALQAVASSTRLLDGTRSAGPAYIASLNRRGRQFNASFRFLDVSPGFQTLAGFVPRNDIRTLGGSARYQFRPEGKRLIAWGPSLEAEWTWDHSGTRLNWIVMPEIGFDLVGQTHFEFFYALENELLRPQDAVNTPANLDFHRVTRGGFFTTSLWRQVTVSGSFRLGQRINLDPPGTLAPHLANRHSADLSLTLRPTRHLRIDNSYLFFRLTSRADGSSIFNNHILRSKWNYQFTRELSARLIFQYDALLANPANTSLETTRNFNADFLLTYLLYPGTAVYVGYNSNLQNVALAPCLPASGCSTQLLRTRHLANDARGFFFKFSYLFRF